MMKRIINILVFLVLCLNITILCYGQNNDTLLKAQKGELLMLEEDEIFLYTTACSSQPRVTMDTLGADSIAQQYYPNGQLYSLTPYNDGNVDGVCYKYNSNGTLKSCIIYEKGYPKDAVQVEYDKFGYIRMIGFDVKCAGKTYRCLTYCFYGEPFCVDILLYRGSTALKLVSEYAYSKETNDWRSYCHHTNPHKRLAKNLLKAYRIVYDNYDLYCLIRTTKIKKGIDY
jgi:hypothetical protein